MGDNLRPIREFSDRFFAYKGASLRINPQYGFWCRTSSLSPRIRASCFSCKGISKFHRKASADHFVKAFHDTYGMPINITRCSNNYGPYQFPEKLIPLMINNVKHHKQLPVYGDGMQIRDWLYVEDHCIISIQA